VARESPLKSPETETAAAADTRAAEPARRGSREVDAIVERALRAHQAGRLKDAVDGYRQALALERDHQAALNNLGVALRAAGRTGEAVQAFRRAIEANPEHADAHYNLGNALRAAGDPEAATKCFRAAIERDARYTSAYTNLGLVCKDLERLDEARQCMNRALQLAPADPKSYLNLGVVLWEQKKSRSAVACYRHGLAIDPDDAQTHHNLATALLDLNQLEEAADSARAALARNSALPETHAILGQALCGLARLDEAERCFEHALALDAGNLSAHLGMARALLLEGDYQRGMLEYEWRWKRPTNPMRTFPQPLWDGSDPDGRTVLLHAEQGIGDTLQFVRYATPIAARGARVVIECAPAIAELVETVDGVSEVVHRGHPLPAFDLHAPLLGLPRIMRSRIDEVPCDIPYLSVPEGAPDEAPDLPARGGLRVGVAWAGNPQHENDKNRSCHFGELLPLLEVPGVRRYSLQKGPAVSQVREIGCEGLIRDLGTGFRDFVDTARAVERLDLVIAVDTSVIHLAGALGRPAWVMLPFAPDWRWQLGRDDTPWYPTVRLYRQPRPGDWPAVFVRAAGDLRALARAGGGASGA